MNKNKKCVFETLNNDNDEDRLRANLNDIASLIKKNHSFIIPTSNSTSTSNSTCSSNSGSSNTRIKNIIVMAGAGISTRAGIPDFRSPETGLYANLEKFKLPYPEAIFDIDYFKENPIPFYTLAEEMNPKKYKPTKTHYFLRLLENKSLLRRCFTQNIDTLERKTGLSDHLIVEAHGSFATSHCLDCHTLVTDDQFMKRLLQNQIPLVKCVEKSCLGNPTALVKPDIVFFGEQLPRKFYESLGDFSEADLLIVLGTSLQVQPFASLINKVPENCPRLLINLEPVGEISPYNPAGFDFKGVQRGGKKFIRDVLYLGTTDDGIEELCDLLGWKDELLDLYNEKHKTQTSEESDDKGGIEHKLEKKQNGEISITDKTTAEDKSSSSQEETSESRIPPDGVNHATEQLLDQVQDEQESNIGPLSSILDELSLSKKL